MLFYYYLSNIYNIESPFLNKPKESIILDFEEIKIIIYLPLSVMTNMKGCLWIYFFFLLNISSYGIDTIVVNKNTPVNKFFRLTSNNIEILPDPSGKLTFEEVKTKAFRPLNESEINIQGDYIYPRNIPYVWTRFIFKNESLTQKSWLIEFLDFATKNVKVYIPDDQYKYKENIEGFCFPFANRKINHKNLDFNIPFSEKPQVCYFRIEHGASPLLVVNIKSYYGFIEYALTEYYFLGLFYGIILVMGIYNLILYINIGEKHYLFYVFYVTCVGLSSMCNDGTGFQYLWANHPEWNKNILNYSLFGLVFWILFYSKWFLNTKLNAPFTDKIIFYLILIIFALLSVVVIFNPDHSLYLIPGASIAFLLIYVTGIKILKDGFKPARFFLIAFTFFFLGYFVRILAIFNVIENNIFTVYSYNMGVIIEMILFSIAIGDRIKTLIQEKEKALLEKEKAQQQIIFQLQENETLKDKVNKELEDKVQKRTLELGQKNQELEIANEQLKVLTDKVNGWNIKLDLDNRKLQTNVKELEQARIMLKDVKFDEFGSIFPNENACFKYLADLKWKDGYICKKCANENFGKGKSPFGRRCTKCNYDESPTNNTLFHRLRFPITKAFYMVYIVSIKEKEITSDELSEVLNLRRETCWSFKRKIMLAKKNIKKSNKSEEVDGWAALALISI